MARSNIYRGVYNSYAQVKHLGRVPNLPVDKKTIADAGKYISL
jgi:hypothetical protein